MNKIEINNYDTVLKAFEGILISKNYTSDNLEIYKLTVEQIKAMQTYIKFYTAAVFKLPFPLCCIEEEIKYASIAMIIQYAHTDSTMLFRVEKDGIVVGLETGVTNKYIGVKLCGKEAYVLKGIFDSNYWQSFVSLNKYEFDVCYNEYKWVVDEIISGRDTNRYYEVFMPELFKDCNNDLRVLREKLGNLLVINNIPKEITNVRENAILDINCKYEYTMEVFKAGNAKTGKHTYRMVIGKDNKVKLSDADKEQEIFNYKVYRSRVYTKYTVESIEHSIRLREEIESDGMMSLFEKLMNSGIEHIYNRVYRGVKCEDTLIFVLNGIMYKAKFSKYAEAIEICRNADIIGIKDTYLYYYTLELLSSGVKKNTIMSYNLITGENDVCIIKFEM